jgi:ribosomal-protein-alanine N-acetyltransferase
MSDMPQVLAAIRASRALHGAWVAPPATAARYAAYVERFAGPGSRDPHRATHVGLLACRVDDDAPVGVFNLSEIVRGAFHSAYLGYYGLAPHDRLGYMGTGLALALQVAFRKLGLHRVEANVQPANVRSIALVKAAGFTREGYSRRYLKLAGRWRDHERWALLAEDWRARAKRTR